jgi:lactoylglutathione lyase
MPAPADARTGYAETFRAPAEGIPEHVELQLNGFTTVLQPPRDTGKSNRNALLRDPDGNLVEIVAKMA